MDKSSIAADGIDRQLPYRLTYMFHPTILVPDLDETGRWYESVFGLPSIRRDAAAKFKRDKQDPNNRTDYSTFVMIRDVLLNFIDPRLFVSHGVRLFPPVDEPVLEAFGWYVEGIEDLYHALRSAGVKAVGMGEEDTGDKPPTARQSSAIMFLTVPDDIGFQYQFISPLFPGTLDPRMEPGWELGSRRDDDPLGIDFTSHHTTLTQNPKRLFRLFVDLLGGRVIHEGRNEALGATSTYVRLADGVYELAEPDVGTPAHDDLTAKLPHDCYHSITFKVANLDKVRRHLEAQDVALRADSTTMVITDPKTSDGIPFGFIADAIPGDDRS
jgi:catechol 2,3-dioxygenase-like lactoylglutathione lyase family enzyme